MNKIIFFDWDIGIWMFVDDNGNTKEWYGASMCDANEMAISGREDYPTLAMGSKSEDWGCLHDWATYDSGFTAYEFCTKCDTKRDIPK